MIEIHKYYGVYRERPKCRKILETWIAEDGLILEDAASGKPCTDKDGFKYSLSDGLITQARKMLLERKVASEFALENKEKTT